MSTTTKNIEIRKANDRGRTRIGWLDSWHSFSFGQYQDPAHMGYHTLRVINDDVIAPGGGFGEHPHRDMEIITWVLDGELRHGDSLGSGGVIRPGEVQVMTAGRGIRHSEFNASPSNRVHLLQIWIEPREKGLPPRYEQRAFDASGRANQWQLVVSPDGRDGSMLINQDTTLSIADLDADAELTASVADGRFGYLHVARGKVSVDDVELAAGDAVKITGPAKLTLAANEASEVLMFELP